MSKHGSKGQRVVDLDDAILGHRLRASDLKTRMKYAQCDARHTVALKGHPFYKDITLKSVSRYQKPVSRYHRRKRENHVSPD